jgi:hypothetical protein
VQPSFVAALSSWHRSAFYISTESLISLMSGRSSLQHLRWIDAIALLARSCHSLVEHIGHHHSGKGGV